ncbi:MAG TPA: hypothetical protein VNT26_09425, partial [Candidatus Sulfotelmatobacter sp.]|nr:hypothetical protein [Candidatus Sulfotelmatobacter sp.]
PRLDPSETVESLATRLEALLSQTGFPQGVMCRALDSRLPWGVRCVSARQNATVLVYLQNVGKEVKTVSLSAAGTPLQNALDLLRNEKISPGPITVQPFEMRLLLASTSTK